jgi:outer membrane autotransporter protein
MHTALYAGVEAGGWHGQASLGCSRFEADGQRDMDLPDLLHVKAQEDFKAWSGLATLNGGYDFKLGSWLTGPTAGAAYALIHQDGFRENGAGFLNLNIDEQDDRSLASTLGWHISCLFELGDVRVMPKASLDWQHEYQFSVRGLSASFSGYESAPFQVSGPSPVADMAILQAGLTVRVKDRVSAFADLGMSLGRDYAANSVGFGLQFQF